MIGAVLNRTEKGNIDKVIEQEIGHQEAIDTIRELRGIKFDPAIVDLFLRILAASEC